MRRILHLCLVLSLIGITLLSACEPEPKPTVLQPPPTSVERYDLSVVRTIGNHSYMPLNIQGTPADHIDEILGALQTFEKNHPELEVVGWWVEKHQVAFRTSNYIYGLWVDHRPKGKG